MTQPVPIGLPELAALLSSYTVGDIRTIEPLTAGTVQANYAISSEAGKFVLRLYRNRSNESVLYEIGLLDELCKSGFPCACPIADTDGSMATTLRGRPATLFRFVAGQSVSQPNQAQMKALLDAVARLHTVTEGRDRFQSVHRWNYTEQFCRERLRDAADRSTSPGASLKLSWLLEQLGRCEIPDQLPKGVCHCDFDCTNILFDGDRLTALLDFDDANYTWLVYDLINLMENFCWSKGASPDRDCCARMVKEYGQRRPLRQCEQEHLFDVHRYQVVLDSAWFFESGTVDDFQGRRRLEFLDSLGRKRYRQLLGIDSPARSARSTN